MAELSTAFRCAAAAETRGEAVIGTASRIDRWLLVEAPGPWGPRALPTPRGVGDQVIHDLQLRARAAHARVLLIRRPGAPSDVTGDRTVYAADSRPGHEVLLRRVVSSEAELDRLEPPFDGDVQGWDPAAALVGVCTHGKHDVCCATRGRPVAAALAISHPEITYEVSHIGGDRFAANALVLPWGHYLGRLEPDTAPQVVADVLVGRCPAGHYRGRSVWAPAVQAAQHFAAQQLDVDAVAALSPQDVARLADHRWQVDFAATGGPLRVTVEQELGPDSARLTCHAELENATPSWRLVDVAAG